MQKIYLDSNVLRFLKKEENSEFLNFMFELKEYFLFYYSEAHIEDLKRDDTDFKFSDLNFMEKLVENNFMIFDPLKSNVNILFATPLERFNKIAQENTFPILQNIPEINQNILLLIANLLDPHENKILIDTISSISEIPIEEKDVNLYDFFKIPSDINNETLLFLNNLEIFNKTLSHEEFKKFCQKNGQIFENDNKIYKQSRTVLNNEIQIFPENGSINDNDFKIRFSNSNEIFNFEEILNKLLIVIQQLPIANNFYFKYTTAFILLNQFKIDRENNNKTKYINTKNDALHSYYGLYADIVVSNDNKFLFKSKELCKFFSLSTSFLTIEDFKEIIENLFYKIENFEDFENAIISEINNGDFEYELRDNIEIYTKLLSKSIIGFEQIEIFKSKLRSVYILSFNKNKSYNLIFYNEIKIIVNKLFKVLGTDNYNNSLFTDIELEQINNQNWFGRVWEGNNFELLLKMNFESNNLEIIFIIFNKLN